MGDTALDLSAKPSALQQDIHPAKIQQDNFRSGRSSTSSLGGHEQDSNDSDFQIKREIITSPYSERSAHSPAGNSDEERGSSSEKSSSGTTPSRPFKMYSVDSLPMYNSTTSSSPVSPVGMSPIGMPNMYDHPSSFPSFPLTPLTSHLLQRKRRAENRTETPDPKKTKPVPEEKKDESYWERRRKNNEAAKRSRDTRRCKEEEIAMRAAFLEQENLKLRAQVAILKNETAKLHYMLYNRL